MWNLDEVVVMSGGRNHWLWRTVDQDGYIRDEIVQSQRNTKAAKRLRMRLMKKQRCLPKRVVAHKLRSFFVVCYPFDPVRCRPLLGIHRV